MKIGVLGAGFTGLSLGYELAQNGHKVIVIEKESLPGGLALGFRQEGWGWTLEKHYHHFFTSDNAIKSLAKKVGVGISFVNAKTCMFYNNRILQIDSLTSLMMFPYLGIFDKIRTGIVLGILKCNVYWKPLERVPAKDFLIKTMGLRSWEVLWQPLFEAKFRGKGEFVSAAWFWGRIYKRSKLLGYPKGGFLNLAEKVTKKIKDLNGKFYFGREIKSVAKTKNGFSICLTGGEVIFVDKLISTLPWSALVKLYPDWPKDYLKKIQKLEGLGSVTLVLALDTRFFSDNTYWLNINEAGFPFLNIVEHTNLVSAKNYGDQHILYLGNYLPRNHRYFRMGADQLIKDFLPFIMKVNPRFQESSIKKSWVFKADFSQPILPLNYSKHILPHKTPVEGFYVANMQQVYPWDRGTNYAVDMGRKVARMVVKDENVIAGL